MTDYTPDLHLPLVAPNQDQKEATINTALAILEASANDAVTISLSSGNVTLNDDQYTKYFLHKFSGHTVARTVNLPNTRRWFAAENLGSASITLQVTGGAGASVEIAAGKVGLIVSDGADLRVIVPDPTNGLGVLADLSDVSGVPTDGQLLRWFADDNSWKPWSLSLAFRALSDTPNSYAAKGGMLLAVTAAENGIEFVSSAANVNSFVDLDDAPVSYTGAAGRTVKVNSAATGLVFAQPRLTEAADFPANYTGAAGKLLRVNSTANGVLFDTIAIADLTDGPGAPTVGNALRYVRLNAAGTALEYALGTGGPDKFTDLLDTPAAYTSFGGLVVRVGEDEDRLIFAKLAFTDLEAVPSSYAGAAGKFLQVNPAANALIYGQPKVEDLSNGPGAPSGNSKKIVRVNTGATALEYIELAITDLKGFPSSLTGQGGKYVIVKPDASGLAFTNASYTTNFLALTDVGETSYTGKAGYHVIVDPSATGLILSKATPVPTKLGDLSDVEDGTGVPAEGFVLTWKEGVWQAEPPVGGGSGSTTLAGLTDVDFSTPPVDGNVLTYEASTGKWLPGTASTVAALDDLTDVNLSTPVGGQVLTYRDGEWVNEDSVGQGVPSNGSHPYWRLLLHTTDGSTTRFGIQEIEFKQTKTGADLATGGTPAASSTGEGSAAGAFDDVIAGAWFSTTATDGEWISYQFTTPAEVRYLTLKGSQDYPNQSPASFSVQYSDDGTAWTTAWEVTGQTGWAAGQTREFHAPLDLFFTDLADVPQSYIGQALKLVRVNSTSTGLEFFTADYPTTLAALTDVNIPTPADDQVLSYDALTSQWVAKTLAIPEQFPAYRGVWSGSGENVVVDMSGGTPPTSLTYDASGWTVVSQPDTTAGTTLALKSRAIGNNELCYAEFTADFVSDTPLVIRYKVSSEPGFDFFRVLVDGSQIYQDSGNSGEYEEYSTTLSGIHTVRFQYSKDGSGVTGDDCTYVSTYSYKKVLDNPFVYGDTVIHNGITYYCLSPGTTAEPGSVDQDDWIAFDEDTGGPPALADLTDVQITTTPTAGQVLTWDNGIGKWVAQDPPTGVEVPVSPHGAHPYWRVLFLNNQGGATIQMGDVNFRDNPNNPFLTLSPGVGAASSTTGAHNADAVFDSDDTTYWESTTATNEWVSYHFTPDTEVMSVWMRSTTDAGFDADKGPESFEVQYSDDNSSWTTAWSDTGLFPFVSGQEYESLDPGITYESGGIHLFTQLDDVPSDYTGDAGKVVKVNPAEDGLIFDYVTADFGCFISGKPANAEKVVRFVVATPFTVMTGTHQGSADGASTASKVFSFLKNGVEFVNATFAIAGTTATFSANTETAFAAGDVLSITAPAAQDATLSDISFTLKARR